MFIRSSEKSILRCPFRGKVSGVAAGYRQPPERKCELCLRLRHRPSYWWHSENKLGLETSSEKIKTRQVCLCILTGLRSRVFDISWLEAGLARDSFLFYNFMLIIYDLCDRHFSFVVFFVNYAVVGLFSFLLLVEMRFH